MRINILLGMAILLASCSVAIAGDDRCEPLKSEDGDHVGLQLCEKLEVKTPRPRCYDIGSRAKWLCTDPIGQPVSRDIVTPENCKKSNGKWICPKS
jgi:hypothetical protein